ncbi:chromosomal replication initiator protein DnaA [Candidatus Dojkabacteria bacterium]|nr:chromosomal replication initiator protein DnaA [Candidatus Dojkabacteria bacterium]
MERLQFEEEKTADIPKPTLMAENDSNSQDFDIDEVWKVVKEQLRMYLTPRVFSTWYSSVTLVKLETGIAEFSCDSSYKKEWILSNNIAILKKVLRNATGQNFDILINLHQLFPQDQANDSDSQKPNSQPPKQKLETKYEYYNPKGSTSKQSGTSSKDDSNQTSFFKSDADSLEHKKKEAFLNSSYTISSFIVGSNNRLAFAVAEAVIESPGDSYNPVFYYGGTGVGKTHLMQAIGNEIVNRDPETKIIYCPIEKFLNELIMAIRQRKNEEFRNKYRKVDVLLLDDIQAISRFVKTQDEVFNTFNTLYLANKQIIMASDRPPKEISNLTDRLRSRFQGGMVVDIQTPDIETRLAILQQTVQNHKVQVPMEILHLIAERIETNVRELEGAITKVITTMRIDQKVPTQEEVEKMLQLDIASKRKRITPKKILSAVCEVFDVKNSEIKGKRRTAYIALARQVAMYLLRNELDYPLEKVAHEVNRKDHTTVIHACDKIEEMLEEDEKFAVKIARCKTQLSD